MSDNNIDEDIVVRHATRSDMHEVCGLIMALAVHTNFQDQVKMTPEKLIKDGFETNPPEFSCFVAAVKNGGPVVGFAFYFSCYKTWIGKSIFLEDLYIDPNYRNRGVGTKLLLAVAKVAYETSKRLDFHVLKWNDRAVEFYKRLGTKDLSELEKWQLFRLDEDSLNKIFDS